MLLVVGAQMNDVRLTALIGILRPKSPGLHRVLITSGEQCKCTTQ